MAITIQSGGPQSGQQVYQNSVEAVLTQIGRTHTGRVVLDLIDRASFDVVIQPNLGAGNFNNAFEAPASRAHGGNARLGEAARGSRSFIEFSPNRLSGRGVQFAHHEVLLHELCHGLRSIYGRAHYDGAGNDLAMSCGFDTVEEFFAVMVTSVHSSELGRAALGDHGSWALPSVDLLRRAPFNTRLRQFNTSMPELCSRLRAIPVNIASFNPFRDVAIA